MARIEALRPDARSRRSRAANTAPAPPRVEPLEPRLLLSASALTDEPDVDWAGVWHVSGYDMLASTGYTGAYSTQWASNVELAIDRLEDGTYYADPGDADYAFTLEADGVVLSGRQSGYDEAGDYFESYVRMMAIGEGVAIFLYGEGGYNSPGNWWGSAYAGLAAVGTPEPTPRPFIGEYDLDEYRVAVDTATGELHTQADYVGGALRMSYLGGNQYAAYDLADLDAPAPVFMPWGERLLRNTADTDAEGNYVRWYQTFYRGPGDTLYYLGHDAVFDSPLQRDLWWANFYVGVAWPRAGFEWGCDLTGEIDMSRVDDVAFRSAALTVPVRVTNDAMAPVRSTVRIDLYASTDDVLDAGDVLIGSLANASVKLAGGAERTYNVAAAIPAEMPYGTYHLLAAIDADDAVAELDEANNVAAGDETLEIVEPRRDLVGELTRLTLPDVLVPGDRGICSVTVTNLGNVPAVGPIGLRFYLSTDPTLERDTDVAIAALTHQRLLLAPDARKTYSVRLTVPPNAPPGEYYLLAEIDSANAVEETDETNNVAATDDARTLYWRFGTFESRRNVRLTVLDRDGRAVTFAMRGGGWGEVFGASDFALVELNETTTRSRLTIAPPRRSRTTVGDILAHGSLRDIYAPAANLAGSVTVEGLLVRLVLGDVAAGGQIDLNTAELEVTSRAAVTMVFDRVVDSGVDTHGLAIRSLTATDWTDVDGAADSIVATWMGRLVIRGRRLAIDGDFHADLELTGRPEGQRGYVLGAVKIVGSVGDAAWHVAGSAGRVYVLGSANGWTAEFDSLRSLVLGDVQDASVTVADALGLAKAYRWADGRLDADTIRSLVVTGRRARRDVPAVIGDFGATLVVRGNGATGRKRALGTAKIVGDLAASNWDVTGNMGRILVYGTARASTVRSTGDITQIVLGATENCNFLAGIDPAVTDHARFLADFTNPGATIRSIVVRGRRLPANDPTRFVINTTFSAATIRSTSLINTNGGDACGLYALAADGNEIRYARYRDTLTGERWAWRSGRGEPPVFGSLTLAAINA